MDFQRTVPRDRDDAGRPRLRAQAENRLLNQSCSPRSSQSTRAASSAAHGRSRRQAQVPQHPSSLVDGWSHRRIHLEDAYDNGWNEIARVRIAVGAAEVEEVVFEEREHVGGVGRLDGEPVGAIQTVIWVSRENATTPYLLPE